MPKAKAEAEGYETLGTGYDQTADIYSMVKQLTDDMIPQNAGYGIQVKFQGEKRAIVTYHTFEVDLHLKMKEVERQADELLKSYEKELKKQYKSRVGKSLKLKEDKDERCTSVEKVSLNSRYYYRSSRSYDIS